MTFLEALDAIALTPHEPAKQARPQIDGAGWWLQFVQQDGDEPALCFCTPNRAPKPIRRTLPFQRLIYDVA